MLEGVDKFGNLFGQVCAFFGDAAHHHALVHALVLCALVELVHQVYQQVYANQRLQGMCAGFAKQWNTV